MTAHFKTMWGSIDFAARLKHCSCSRFAIRGGLDPTAFNKSKRYTKYGQPRWLSFGSLVGVLDGTDMTLIEFAVIYEMLSSHPTFSAPDKMQAAINDVNELLQRHINSILPSDCVTK